MTDTVGRPSADHRDGAAEAQEPEPPETRIFTGQLFRLRRGRSRTFSDQPPAPRPSEPARRPARVALMLAFAHRIEAAIERGDYRDRADVARQLGFTRARVTQLLDLMLLAPDIQEKVVFFEAVDGVEPIGERALRMIARNTDWRDQRMALIAALSNPSRIQPPRANQESC